MASRDNKPDKRGLRAYLPALVMLGVFLTVGVALWLALGNLFYLANFARVSRGRVSRGRRF